MNHFRQSWLPEGTALLVFYQNKVTQRETDWKIAKKENKGLKEKFSETKRNSLISVLKGAHTRASGRHRDGGVSLVRRGC